MSKQKFKNIYQFKITLQNIKPKIWRRIQVPENYSFWDLHVAIQNSMGWEDYHLHEFGIKNPKTGDKVTIGIPYDDGFADYEIIPGNKVKITEYFITPKDKAIYEYDFGDGWEHKIVLEKILSSEDDGKYPRCVAGERACPPEDCGGPWGYEELLEIMQDKEHEEHEEKMAWFAGEFDPEDFAPENVEFDDPKTRYQIAFD